MTWCLWTSRSGWRQTNTIIMKIAILVVESGMLCATVAVVELILFLLYPRSNYHLTPGLILSKLYSNSLFAVSFRFNSSVRLILTTWNRFLTLEYVFSAEGQGKTVTEIPRCRLLSLLVVAASHISRAEIKHRLTSRVLLLPIAKPTFPRLGRPTQMNSEMRGT